MSEESIRFLIAASFTDLRSELLPILESTRFSLLIIGFIILFLFVLLFCYGTFIFLDYKQIKKKKIKELEKLQNDVKSLKEK